MSDPTPPSRLDEAAELLAVGELSYSEVAARLGIDGRTVFRWRQDPEFMARVAALRAGLCAAEFDYGVSLRLARVVALNDRWERLRKLVDDRAADPAMAGAPGGSTGLLIRKVKGLGS